MRHRYALLIHASTRSFVRFDFERTTRFVFKKRMNIKIGIFCVFLRITQREHWLLPKINKFRNDNRNKKRRNSRTINRKKFSAMYCWLHTNEYCNQRQWKAEVKQTQKLDVPKCLEEFYQMPNTKNINNFAVNERDKKLFNFSEIGGFMAIKDENISWSTLICSFRFTHVEIEMRRRKSWYTVAVQYIVVRRQQSSPVILTCG